MAHPCIHCGGECYCNGSLDDAVVDKTPKNCEGCGCQDFDFDGWDNDIDDDDDFDPVGYECIGCLKGYARPGDCPICGNPLEPYG